jgi:uncharacterized protein (DUF1499 family)
MAPFSLAGRRPSRLGVSGGQLAPCPASPNCVSSDASDPVHHVAPLALRGEQSEGWVAIRQLVASWPRTRIVAATDEYLHAECRSALLGFVDDLELHLRPEPGVVAVRSASRLGYSDLGVNRRRVESLRAALRLQGIVD